MQLVKQSVFREDLEIDSHHLQRNVRFDCYLPMPGTHLPPEKLLLINDGQNMAELGLKDMLEELTGEGLIDPLLCVAIYAGDRMMEYGTADRADYQGLGAKAGFYTKFIVEELLPFIQSKYNVPAFLEKAFAGFSLGGLSALDIVWNHPLVFSKAGVFSGSLWWRTKALDEGYDEDKDRIMHAQVRQGKYSTGLGFFFEAGAEDETMDRNNNGIIDSIDDTISLIDELVKKGYDPQKDIRYLELPDGKHNVATWARAMPEFLKWGWGKPVTTRETQALQTR